MPIYQYQAIESRKGCKLCRKGFEITQSMKDKSLGKCPECGKSIQRIISGCSINTKTKSAKSLMSDSSLKNLGFSKLVKGDDGNYKKIV